LGVSYAAQEKGCGSCLIIYGFRHAAGYYRSVLDSGSCDSAFGSRGMEPFFVLTYADTSQYSKIQNGGEGYEDTCNQTARLYRQNVKEIIKN